MKNMWIASFVFVVIIGLALCGHVVGQEPKKEVRDYVDPDPYKAMLMCSNPACTVCKHDVMAVERKAKLTGVSQNLQLVSEEIILTLNMSESTTRPARVLTVHCYVDSVESINGSVMYSMKSKDAEVQFSVTVTALDSTDDGTMLGAVALNIIKYVANGQDLTETTTLNLPQCGALIANTVGLIQGFDLNMEAVSVVNGQLRIGYNVPPQLVVALNMQSINGLRAITIDELIMAKEPLKAAKATEQE